MDEKQGSLRLKRRIFAKLMKSTIVKPNLRQLATAMTELRQHMGSLFMIKILATLFRDQDKPYSSQSFVNHLCRDFEHRAFQTPGGLLAELPKIKPCLLLTDQVDYALLSQFHEALGGSSLVITNDSMEHYSRTLQGQEEHLVQQLFSAANSSDFLLQELGVGIKKMTNKNIFGIERYFKCLAHFSEHTVKGARDRSSIQDAVQDFASLMSLSGSQTRLAAGITEEMVMNAIFDAPLAAGFEFYKSMRRDPDMTLQPGHESHLKIGYDGQILGISMVDPFGAFKRSKLFQYLKKVLVRSDSSQLIDTKEMGAGLGLYKILYSCHSLICNVHPGHHTEVIALIDCAGQLRDFSRNPRSIQYFQID